MLVCSAMRMTRKEFDHRLKDGTLALTFIGMSGIGKTYHAKRLKRLGFKYISCDDLIAGQIKLRNVTDVGLWLGQPYTPGYKKKERMYLKLEEKMTRAAITRISRNTIVDSTGSIIYLSSALRKHVKKRMLVVYFRAEPDIYERMLTLYLADPKPVVWGSSFKQKKGENPRKALARSFSGLLDFRAKRYTNLADVTIPAKLIRNGFGTPKRLLRLTRDRLK